MIQFSCYTCGNSFSVSETLGGTQASCNRCGAIVDIPMPGMNPLLPVEPDHRQLVPLQDAPMPAVPAQATPPQPTSVSATPASSARTTRVMKPVPTKQTSVPTVMWILAGAGVAVVCMAIAMSIVFRSLRAVGSVDSVAENDSVIESTPPASVEPAIRPSPQSSRRASTSSLSSSVYVSPTQSAAPGQSSRSGNAFEANGNPDEQQSESPGVPSRTSAASPSPQTAKPLVSSEADETALQASPKSSPAPVSSGPDWGSDRLRIPFERDDHVTLGLIGCPVVVVKNDVWHIARKEIVQTLEGEYQTRGIKALSANGQWFAAASKSPNQQDTSITVWNVVTGKVSCEIPGDPERFADLIRFSHNEYLLVGGRLHNDIRVFRAETGEPRKAIELTKRIDAKGTAFTPDGQYFTMVDNGQLQVMKTQTRRTAAVMESPQPIFQAGEAPNQVQRKIAAEGVLRSVEVIRFAPDGQEIAAVSRGQAPRLLVWSSRGKLEVDQMLPTASHKFFFDPALDWLPDRSGWIISGHVFDRTAGRIVMIIHPKFGDDLLIRALDRDHLLVDLPHNSNVLEVVSIPWDQINKSLKLLEGGAPALLSPASPVSLNIELAGLRGSQGETVGMITEALGKRL